ncbi:MAG: acyltransferase [Burkholderiales bacterium]
MSWRWPFRFRSADHGTVGRGSVIYPSARLVNSHGGSEAISIGENSHVRGELLTFGHGGRVRVGDYCYVGEQTRIWSAKSITIGDRVLIAHLVSIFDNLTHPFDPVLRHRQFRAIVTTGQPRSIDLQESPVVIEDDAWIAAHSVVLAGVRIGRAAIVGAGSVVTSDVAPYTVVAGNPARFVREVPRGD